MIAPARKEAAVGEQPIKADNRAGAPQSASKRAIRKTARQPEDNKMSQSKTPQEVVAQTKEAAEDTVTEAKKAVETKVEEATAAEQEAASDVKSAAGGAEPGVDVKTVAQDAGTQIEKAPGTKPVRERVSKVADQLGSNEMSQKAMRRVRASAHEASEQMKQGAHDLEKKRLVVATHKVFLAAVGAAALAQDEIEDLANRLVERGSIAEADGRRMVNEVLKRRRTQMAKATGRAQEVATGMRDNLSEGPKRLADDMEQRIEGVLARMNVPTKDEIETLTSKVTALTRKVDELKKTE
jgi:poly(hydroxyalkanoate) granule-associated protein